MSEEELIDTIRRLKQNDPTLTMLDLRDVNGSRSYVFESGSTVLEDMIQGLSNNTTVHTVSIVLRFLHKLTIPEKIAMFRAVGSLPKLTELRIASMGLGGIALQLINEALLMASKKNNKNKNKKEQKEGTEDNNHDDADTNQHQHHHLKVLTLQSMQYRGKSFYSPASVNSDTPELRYFVHALRQLTHLESFTLQDAQVTFDLDAVVLEGLANLHSLKKIDINSFEFPEEDEPPRISEQSLSVLSNQLPNLTWLSLRRMYLEPLLPQFFRDIIINSSSKLEYLILEQNMIGRECGLVLTELIRQTTVLKGIYLAYNMIPDEVGAEIANALSQNSSIIEFDMTANELGPMSCDAFARTLGQEEEESSSSISNLEFLNLSQHTLPSDNLHLIVTALRQNTKLKSLALMEVQMRDECGVLLADALKDNTTLERINLSDNKLGNVTAAEFGTLLRTNQTLKSINFCSNMIGNSGAILLADALLVNSTLEQLNLVNNHSLGQVSYDAFEVMIQENTSLQHLWLPTVLPGSKISTFVRLNRIGRKELLLDMNNAAKWLRAIETLRDDLVGLYHLIRANPNVVSCFV